MAKAVGRSFRIPTASATHFWDKLTIQNCIQIFTMAIVRFRNIVVLLDVAQYTHIYMCVTYIKSANKPMKINRTVNTTNLNHVFVKWKAFLVQIWRGYLGILDLFLLEIYRRRTDITQWFFVCFNKIIFWKKYTRAKIKIANAHFTRKPIKHKWLILRWQYYIAKSPKNNI